MSDLSMRQLLKRALYGIHAS